MTEGMKTPHTLADAPKQVTAFLDAKKTLSRTNNSNSISPQSKPKKPRAETTPLQPKKNVLTPSREVVGVTQPKKSNIQLANSSKRVQTSPGGAAASAKQTAASPKSKGSNEQLVSRSMKQVTSHPTLPTVCKTTSDEKMLVLGPQLASSSSPGSKGKQSNTSQGR